MIGMHPSNFSRQELDDLVAKALKHGEQFEPGDEKNYEMAMSALMSKMAILRKRKTRNEEYEVIPSNIKIKDISITPLMRMYEKKANEANK